MAIALRHGSEGPEVLLGRRANRRGDRWSGHVSLPGGLHEPSDAHLRATALRETWEEVGVDLGATARLIGRLDEVPAVVHGGLQPLSIAPFVFELQREISPQPSAELTRVFYLPLRVAASGRLDSHLWYRLAGPVRLPWPCWRWDGEVIWGLTYRMLRSLLAHLSSAASSPASSKAP